MYLCQASAVSTFVFPNRKCSQVCNLDLYRIRHDKQLWDVCARLISCFNQVSAVARVRKRVPYEGNPFKAITNTMSCDLHLFSLSEDLD